MKREMLGNFFDKKTLEMTRKVGLCEKVTRVRAKGLKTTCETRRGGAWIPLQLRRRSLHGMRRVLCFLEVQCGVRCVAARRNQPSSVSHVEFEKKPRGNIRNVLVCARMLVQVAVSSANQLSYVHVAMGCDWALWFVSPAHAVRRAVNVLFRTLRIQQVMRQNVPVPAWSRLRSTSGAPSAYTVNRLHEQSQAV